MPFGTITVNTVNYEPRTPGIYVKSGVTFDQPTDEFRIRGASSSKSNVVSSTVTRVLQKDITVGATTERRNVTVSLNVVLPSLGGFTAAEIDGMASDISEFLTTTTISRLLQGES
jgi:hypothetical protein